MYLHSSASNYPTLLRILAMYEKEESFSLTLANEVAFTIMRKRKVPRKRPMGADFEVFSAANDQYAGSRSNYGVTYSRYNSSSFSTGASIWLLNSFEGS